MKTVIIDKKFYEKEYDRFLLYIRCISVILDDLKYEYPDFKDWLQKSYFDIPKGVRSIILKILNEKIVAVAIVKNDKYEQKICTLRVIPRFRELGIGKKLLSESINLLNNAHPLATVSQKRIEEFRPLLVQNAGFEETIVLDSLYTEGVSEFIFNGTLKHSRNYFYLYGCNYFNKAHICKKDLSKDEICRI